MKKILFLFTLVCSLCLVLVSCGNVSFGPSTYRIDFDSNGGTEVESIIAEAGSAIEAPADPTKEGYEFLGWNYENKLFVFDVMPTQDITLVAIWKQNYVEPEPDPIVIYTIEFDVDGGSAVSPISAEAGTEITLPTTSKEGYNFVGWMLNNELYEATTMPEANLVLVAKWEEIIVEPTKYTITFYVSNGSEVEDIVAEAGTPIVLPTPTKEGYSFAGWVLNGQVYTTEVMPAENLTLVAKWENAKFTITFDVDGGSKVENIVAEAGDPIVLPTTEKEGYNFLGWYLNDVKYEATVMPKENVDLVAKWEEIVYEDVEVTYELNGGWYEYADLAAVKAAFDVDYKALTGLTSYSIWNHGEELAYVFTKSNGKWNWLLDYWADVNTNSYNKQTNASQFMAIKDGGTINDYYFFGVEITSWYTSEKKAVYSGTLVSADYADPTVQLRMWDFLSAEQEETVTLEHGTALPTEIYNIGYTFAGWYTTADFQEGTKVTEATQSGTLYAKWEKAYNTLTYVVNNESASVANPTVEFTARESVVLVAPTFDAAKWEFLGWFADEALTKVITEVEMLTLTDVSVYGGWKQITGNEFEVNYVLNGGNWYFEDHDELVVAFIADYNATTGKSVTAENFYSDAANGTHVFFDDKDMFAKWGWMLQFFFDLGEEGYGYHSESQNQYKIFLAGNGSTVTSQWAVRQNIQGFLTKTRAKKYSTAAAIDFENLALVERFWENFNASQATVFEYDVTSETPQPKRQFFTFKGWYDNAELTGDPITNVTGETTLYASWAEETPVSKVTITNKVDEAKAYSTLQLEWTLEPSNAGNQTVAFSSSDSSVATVNETGLVTMHNIGTVTITVTSLSSSKASDSFTFNVYEPGHFNASYETESYVEIGKEIKLIAEYINKEQEQVAISWSSLNTDIATVNDGVVTGVAAGLATIRVTAGTETFDFVVTVLPANISAALQHAINSHESNVFIKYNLPIGYPESNQGYYKDVISSVSKLFYNHELQIDDSMLDRGNSTGAYYENSVKNTGLEFITVHYTGTFATTADTDNIATNFTNSGTSVSIHYVTGNKGVKDGAPSSEVYHTLSHDHGAWHAGDSNGYYYANSAGDFKWLATGVKYDGVDLLDIEWTASTDFYYEINGQKTTIKLPNTWNYKERNTDHIYNADGTITSQPDFTLSWAKFNNRTPESFFSDQDFGVKVINGEYYMAPTWWSFGQVSEGRICTLGGNRNSIGIESCVNEGSDVWYTWQVTAQLVAKLMNDNNLGIERVKGHHFFDGKDCPQPLLENDLEIWNMFIEMVQAEYELLTTFKDVEFAFETVEEYDFVSENGRITEQPEFTQVVQYTVTVNGESITLASVVSGIYNK